MRTLIETANLVRKGKLSAREAVADAFVVIEKKNGPLNAFIMLDRESADRIADEIDAKIACGEDAGPLAGVPIGVKDLEDCVGFPTTQGCYFLKNASPQMKESVHMERLRAAGAIPIGKTAASEFGMDSATFTTAWGVTRNPWNPDKTPGGSSGGSSSAVAAGMVPLATATDAGGSTREPAAFTGLVGLKPSHGRIPKVNGFSNWSVHGGLTRTVADTARYLDAVSGPDDRDRQSLPPVGYRYEDVIETLDTTGARFVWSADHGYAAVEREVVEIARAAAERLAAAAGLVEVDEVFHPTNVYRHWGGIMLVNIEEELTEEGILPDGFDMLAEQTKRMILLMRERRHEINLKESWAAIHRLEQEVAALFRSCDLLITPATACRPYDADATIPTLIDGRDASESGAEPFGMLANICWNPSISIPAGLTSDGLPVGLQITARRHRDDLSLRLARLYERGFPWSCPD